MDGVIYEEGSEVVALIVRFYKTLYQETEELWPSVEGLKFDQTGRMERGWLEMRFKEEILLAIKELEGIKLKVSMASLWPLSIIAGELWKEMYSRPLKSFISTISLKNLLILPL